MGKKPLQPDAKIIEWQLVVWHRFHSIPDYKPILGAAAIADRKPGTGAAFMLQEVSFVFPKADLNRKLHQIPKMTGFNIPDAVFRANIVIAAKNAPIHFHN